MKFRDVVAKHEVARRSHVGWEGQVMPAPWEYQRVGERKAAAPVGGKRFNRGSLVLDPVQDALALR